MTLIRIQLHRKAMFLPTTLVVVMIVLVLSTALLSMVMASLKRSNLYSRQISATNIAEAGVNYYLWHLAHSPNNFTDGHDDAKLSADGYYGPFSHNYLDATGEEVGSYELYIYPPDISSATVKVRSIGHVKGANLQKSILTQLSMPYFSKFFLLSFIDETWIGPNETVNGPVHSNNPLTGIRNEGKVGRATATCIDKYNSPSSHTQENCIWGSGTFSPNYQYPVDSLDLASINYSTLKTQSTTPGNIYYAENTGSYIGYHLILGENSYELRKVKNTTSHRGGFPDGSNPNIPDQIRDSNGEDSYLVNQAYPESGLMFLEDNVWIEGTLKDHKMTVVAAKPTETRNQFYKNIYILNNLKYAEKNSATKLGLISQKDIIISSQTPANLTIDGALLTKNNYIFLPNYAGQIKGTLNMFGSLAHKGGLIFTWMNASNQVVSGFPTTHYDHDTELIFSPPPYFPRSGNYQIISWQEDPNF